MKTTKRFWAAIAVIASIFASCSDIDEIMDKVDELDGRLTALETVTTNLNKNIEAMQTLYGGATINSATNANGTWTIVLSNGETLTLTQGSIGVGNAPIMSVDKDGYWMVDYDGNGGETPQYIMNGDNKVLAMGTNGKTPIFGVDASGYWTVKYDATATPEQVLGADGQPVKALPEEGVQDPYFEDVKVENGEFKVILHSGEELVIPVVSNFLCAIESTGVQAFNAGETKPFNVNIKGVKSTMITTPAGWSAVLSEPVNEKAVLTVTAPITTKATIADSKSDICILAFSNQGLATIAKMSVSCSDTPVVANPVASVTAGEATSTTLAYSVAVSDVTSWMYIHQKSSDAAPDASKIKAEGVAGSETSLIFENLDPSTEYSLYVLPINGEKHGTVASGKNTTTAAAPTVITDLYQAYLDGKEIEIAGVKYSQAINGEAVLLEATDAETDIRAALNNAKKGVFFLDSSKGSFITSAIVEIKGDMVLIGRHTTTKVGFKPNNHFKFVNGSITLKNLAVNMENLKNESGKNNGTVILNDGTEDLKHMHIDGCTFFNMIRPIYNSSTNGCKYGVKSIVVTNSTIDISGTDNVQIINLYNTSVLAKFEEIKFDNNIVCNDENGACQVLNWGNSTVQTETGYQTVVSLCNNTFYNAPGANPYIKLQEVTSLVIKKNILWADVNNDKNNSLIALYGQESAEGIDISDNIAYGLSDGKNWDIAHSKSTYKPEVNRLTKLTESPISSVDFNTYTFTPIAAYASYGAQR